jgi:hypothetical protein
MFNDDTQTLIFGIPIEPEYRDIAREAWRELRLSIQYGPKDLAPADRARTELVLFLADCFRRRGVPRPMAAAWNVIGTPDPKEFAGKLQPGQPLGDLAPSAVLDKFKPLVLDRLKHFRVAGDEDARAAAQLGLLNALAGYDPAVDVSVGLYAKVHFHIDDEIKRAIRGKASDAWYHKPVSGDEELFDDEGESAGERWEVIPKAALFKETACIIDNARDKQGRLQAGRIPFPTAMWLAETSKGEAFGARFESWIDAPATPQEMVDYLAAIPADKVAAKLTRLSKLERDIVTQRFYRNPPTLLDTIARDKKLSYHRVLTSTHRAVRELGGGRPIKTKPPIRRPMRMPLPPRNVPTRPHGPPDFQYARILDEIQQSPWLDDLYPTVHNTRITPDNFFDPT